jgi:phage-related protein
VQQGEFDASIKPLKGLAGVYEIRADYDTDTYRTVYVLNLGEVIYVLTFSRKSQNRAAKPQNGIWN